jgi:hypothetical protein
MPVPAIAASPATQIAPAVIAPQDHFNVFKGVTEWDPPGGIQQFRLPLVFPVRITLGQRKNSEVHGAHVEATHLGLSPASRRQPFVQAHQRTAAG